MSGKNTCALLFFSLVITYPSPLFSETSADTILIHPPKESFLSTKEGEDDTALFSDVIDPTTHALEGKDLSSVLQNEAGIQIKRYGGLDSFSTVSIRGSTSEQVTIYMDGVPLQQAMGGATNLSQIPLEQVEKITVYHGAAPAHLATSSIGGVILIETKKVGQKRTCSLSQGVGSFRTFETNLRYSDKIKKIPFQTAYTYQRSKGNFSYENDNGTPFNTTDDQTLSRDNNQHRKHRGLISLDMEGPWETNIQIRNQLFREDRRIPGLGHFTATHANLSTTQNTFTLQWDKQEPIPGLNLTYQPFLLYTKSQLADPLGEIGLGQQDSDDDSFQYGSQIHASYVLGKFQKWGLHLHHQGDHYLPEDFSGSSTFTTAQRQSISLGIEDEIYLFSENLILNPSFRTEHHFTRSITNKKEIHPLSAKVGIKYSPHKSLHFKTNLSRSYRIPSFSELFGNRGSWIGNPALEPESGINWDMGLVWDAQKMMRIPLSIRLGYYLNHVSGLIQMVQTSQLTARSENLAKARIQGMELSLKIKPSSFIEASSNYTFQHARDSSGLPGRDGNLLPGRPLHEWHTRLTYLHRWGNLYGEVDFMSDNYLDSQNILVVRQRSLVTIGTTVRFLKRFQINIEGQNLFNNRIADLVGFPLPGRSFYGTFQITI